jgi:hypothetical protein
VPLPRARIETGLWLALIAAAIVMTMWAALSSTAPDDTGALVSSYGSFARDLPDSGRVGFLRTQADSTAAARQLFVAQYALSPRLLVEDSLGVELIVSGPAAGAAADQRMAREGFALVREGPAGIRLYRRMRAP